MKARNGWFKIVSLLAVLAIGVFLIGPDRLTAGEKSKAPKDLKIGVVMLTVVEEPFNTMLLQGLERVQAEHPHGLNISWDLSENVPYPDCERVLKNYAKTGKYDIIWFHVSNPEAIKAAAKAYPDTMWVFSASGHKAIGGNAYWCDMYVHEPAYLMGIMAGMMTKTNILGAVAGYPYPQVNLPINAFKAGAKSVNPDVKLKMTYIESWFDPPKAKQSALAQIASGADFIYAERFGPFEACKEKGILGFRHWVDQNDMAPEVVLSSAVAFWDPVMNTIIDIWWDHVTKGMPFDAPMTIIQYGMAEGASDIAPYHGLASKVPPEVKKKVEQARADIKAGKLKVPYIDTPAMSD